MARLPLEGIRVLELGEALAGPFASAMLGDAGAECIKIESIQRARGAIRPVPGSPGYANNDISHRPWERNASSNHVNRSKMGITLDLSRPRGLALFKRLVAVADVVLENYSSGTIDRMGLGYDVLRTIRPDLIMISMSGFGATGPYRGYASFGFTIDAMVGQTALRGYPEDDPSEAVPSVHCDAVSACNAIFAVAAALVYRQRTGRGQYIDMAQAEGFMPHLAGMILDHTMNDRQTPRLGNRHQAMAPQGAYPCRGDDRWVAISVRSDEDWARLGGALGDPEWTQDPRFATVADRLQRHDELDAHLAAWTREREPFEVMRVLQQAGVPAAPFMTEEERYADPHLNARGFFELKTHREAGTHRYPGPVWKFSKTPMELRLLAPCLGEHNEQVLGGLLGLTPDELDELAAERYIGTEFIEGAELSRADREARERR